LPHSQWIALALLLYGSKTMPAVAGLGAVWLAFYLAIVIGNRGIMPIPGAAYFIVSAAIATTLWIPVLVDRLVTARLAGIVATLAFPLAWVAVEFLRSRLTSFSTWDSIAYTQSSHLPLMQLTAVTGIWGVTFLICWGASTTAYAWTRDWNWADVRIPVLVCLCVTTLIFAAGTVRLALAPTDRPTVRVATVNRPTDIFHPASWTRISSDTLRVEERAALPDQLVRLHSWFFDQTRREPGPARASSPGPKSAWSCWRPMNRIFLLARSNSRRMKASISRWA
jgi:apolipoprotein N-acyltransferase